MPVEAPRGTIINPSLPENGKHFTFRRGVVMDGFDLLRKHAEASGFTLDEIRSPKWKKLKKGSILKDFIAKADTNGQNFSTAELALIVNRDKNTIRYWRRLNRKLVPQTTSTSTGS